MLTWNSDQGCYEADYNGQLMQVDGDLFAEARAERIKTYMEEGMSEEEAYNKADDECLETWVWEGCDGVTLDGMEQG